MSTIYTSKAVRAVAILYGDLLHLPTQSMAVADHLELLVFRLWNAFQEKNPVTRHEISNYHPDFLGQTWEMIQQRSFSLTDAYHTIACEYGFTNWFDIQSLNKEPYDLIFEQSVDHLLNGRLEALKEKIEAYPHLLKQTTQYGHRATLLHYTGSNGFELWRQKVPLNLPTITKYLLDKGVHKNAKMKVYGGQFNTFDLLSSSAHPAEAGIMQQMQEILS